VLKKKNLIINVQNSCAAEYIVDTVNHILFRILWWK